MSASQSDRALEALNDILQAKAQLFLYFAMPVLTLDPRDLFKPESRAKLEILWRNEQAERLFYRLARLESIFVKLLRLERG
jgi:hypothetical protein